MSKTYKKANNRFDDYGDGRNQDRKKGPNKREQRRMQHALKTKNVNHFVDDDEEWLETTSGRMFPEDTE